MLKYYKVCRVRCKRCGSMLEYVNRSKTDEGLGGTLMCECGKVGLDPSASLYRILGNLEDYEDLSEEWSQKDSISEAMEKTLKNLYFELHAVYDPDERGWYCAAVDLFHPGMTFRIYFTLDEKGQIEVEDVSRWYFG